MFLLQLYAKNRIDVNKIFLCGVERTFLNPSDDESGHMVLSRVLIYLLNKKTFSCKPKGILCASQKVNGNSHKTLHRDHLRNVRRRRKFPKPFFSFSMIFSITHASNTKSFPSPTSLIFFLLLRYFPRFFKKAQRGEKIDMRNNNRKREENLFIISLKHENNLRMKKKSCMKRKLTQKGFFHAFSHCFL